MMIQHNHIHAASRKIDNLAYGRRAAVHRNQKLRMMLLQTTLHAFAAQAVTFLHPQRQEQFRSGSVSTQHLCQERDRCYSIDVVVPEKGDALMSIQRAENALDGCLHVWK